MFSTPEVTIEIPTSSSEHEKRMIFNISGRVTGSYPRDKCFHLTSEEGHKFKCHFNFFLVIKRDDYVWAIVRPINGPSDVYNVQLVSEPRVEVSFSRSTISDYFTYALGSDGRTKAPLVYSKIYSMKDEEIKKAAPRYDEKDQKSKDERIVNILSALSEAWSNGRSASIIRLFGNVATDVEVEFLLHEWQNKWQRRRLWLFGLNNREIKNAKLPLRELYYKILKNPFTIVNIDMKKCEKICNIIGLDPKEGDRECAAIARFIYRNLLGGSSYTPLSILESQYPIDFPKYREKLVEDYDIVICGSKYSMYYLKHPYTVERELCNFIISSVERDSRLIRPDESAKIEGEGLEKALKDIKLGESSSPGKDIVEFSQGVPIEWKRAFFSDNDLSLEQKRAVEGSLNHNFSIITGPPGTGKTTIISQIIYNINSVYNGKYYLCALTGKAAARISDVTGDETFTIHRLIHRLKGKKTADEKRKESTKSIFSSAWSGPKEPSRTFYPIKSTPKKSKDEDIIPSGGHGLHIIIDEASMTTSELLRDLIDACTARYGVVPKITLIGDVYQLRPITWGSVMKECVESEVVPIFRLNQNYRTIHGGGEDGIRINSEALVEKMKNPFSTNPVIFKQTNNFRISGGDANVVCSIVDHLRSSGITKHQITVITPKVADSFALNRMIQEIFHKELIERGQYVEDIGGRRWIIGDRVMMIENNYDINVMNGTEGRLTKILDSEGNDISTKGGTPLYIVVDFSQGNSRPKSSSTSSTSSSSSTTSSTTTSSSSTTSSATTTTSSTTTTTTSSRGILEKIREEKREYKFVISKALCKCSKICRCKMLKTIKDNEDEDDVKDVAESERSDVHSLTTQVLIHSIAVTIYRSQGSEWNYVIVYIPSMSGSFVCADSMNVAPTRTRCCVFLVGDSRTIVEASSRSPKKRWEGIEYNLRTALAPDTLKDKETSDMENESEAIRMSKLSLEAMGMTEDDIPPDDMY